ncbi:MAG: hypothetical protein FWH22_04445 [Fibromonadales bacterium]|nr:hypothetical protein [Fibromonadales bacterium]
MKTKYFLSTATYAAMAFIFFACSSDDSGGVVGGSNLSDLPKQVWFVEGDGYGNLIKKEEYKGNGDIELRSYGDEDDDEYDVIPVGKIQNGQISLNLPIDSKWLWKWESCNDTNCQISVVPKNLSVIGNLNRFDANIPNKSNCDVRPYLIKSDEIVRARLFYFSESGKITGTETYDYGGEYTYDMNFSKGWNVVARYRDGGDVGNYFMTTDLSDGELEWWLECRYDDDDD